tara:strand:+ start:7793 stop:8794 length:1002 start_codon:yes stop_codon:yes gene_type:complete
MKVGQCYLMIFAMNIMLAESIILAESEVKCKVGERYVTRSRRRRLARSYCKPCVEGYYQQTDNHNIPDCQACPSGKWTSGKSSGQCNSNGPPCDKGQTGMIAATSAEQAVCTDCIPGKFSSIVGDGPSCYNCKSGTYTAYSKSETCIGSGPCPEGKYGKIGMTTQGVCTDCPAGKYASVIGSGTCIVCDISKYQPKSGQSICLSKGDCSRWQIHKIDSIKCEYIYNYEWYISLIIFGWINIVTHIVVGYKCMFEYTCYIEGFFRLTMPINLGIMIWLTTPHPVNLDDGMNDVEYAFIFAFTFITFACIVIEYINYYKKKCCKEVVKNSEVNNV